MSKRKSGSDSIPKEKKPKVKTEKTVAASEVDVVYEVISDVAPAVEVSEKTEEKSAERKALRFSENSDDQVMDIDSAALTMVRGCKESWLPSIRAKARSMGYEEKATRREWRSVFAMWGGAGILS